MRFHPILVSLPLLLPACAREGREPAPAPTVSVASPEPRREELAEVELGLTRAAVSRMEHGLLIHCDAVLTNRTGQPLQVLSNFSSAFDGLSLVLLSEEGKEIARQAYNYHQSPYAEDSVFPLAPGKTKKTLVIPMEEWDGGAPARARLEGGLRGTRFAGGLVSNEVAIMQVK